MSGAAGLVSTIGNAVGLSTAANAASNVVGNMFGRKKPELGGLPGIQDAALSMYGEGAADYDAQKDNRAAFGQQLADRALGKSPSLAETQMKAAQDRTLKQQLAATKANRAVNPALAFRQTQRMAGDANQQIAQAAGIAKIQEQNQNQAAYQNHLNSIQNSRFSALGAGTGAAQSIAAANAQEAANQNAFMGNMLGTGAQIGAMAFLASDKKVKKNIKREDAFKKPKSEMESVSDANQKVDVVQVPVQSQNFQALMKQFDQGDPSEGLRKGVEEGIALGKKKDKKAAEKPELVIAAPTSNVTGPVSPQMLANPELASTMGVQPGSAMVVDPRMASMFAQPQQPVMVSDKKQKSDVQADAEDFNPKSFLDALKAYSYEYKNPNIPGAGEGRHLSVMAQDLEKAGPVGRSMVNDTSNGKVVDYGKGFGAILAAQAHLNERLQQIESKYPSKKGAQNG
jgi:hypothetical protein